MGDLSKHFSLGEFVCNCGCGFDTVDAELIKVLEELRLALGGPRIMINSASRCENHNRSVGGKITSQHLRGKAADIVVDGIRPDNVADCLLDLCPDRLGVGRYKTFTHIDVRRGKARWDNR